ncbi:hypothetical protein ACFQY5_20020 [Paeniroseomonas aquatica]|uniref:Uncharacterized protein n=1 Tax=Paeniroseomonas aquatica TaxID=373043 RepID=A0ABT8ABM0_9PROT|nr:hypothetical protein [Paeniroseomonas aquatica]MDN3566729.1 hypothetical protein [Paeniroseomonas aquatica]
MRLPTALFGAFLTMSLAGAAVAGSQFHPSMPGIFGLLSEFLHCGEAPDGAMLAFDVLDEAEFLELLEGTVPEAGDGIPPRPGDGAGPKAPAR